MRLRLKWLYGFVVVYFILSFLLFQQQLKEQQDSEEELDCSQSSAIFLDEQGAKSLKIEVSVALASYPRSGNSFLRLLLEKVTGIWTGSIYHDYRLINEGWKGEGYYAKDKVIFVKTHDPLFPKFSKQDFQFQKILYIVRNPFDSIKSYFHYSLSNTHNSSVEILKDSYEWLKFVMEEPIEWKKHVEYWYKKRLDYPFLLVRYEDLQTQPEIELEKIIMWLTSEKDLQNHYLSRLKCVIQDLKQGRLEGYSPRGSQKQKEEILTNEEIIYIFKQTYPFFCSLSYEGVKGVIECRDVDRKQISF